MGTQWWFRRRLPNEKVRDPVQGEFFTEDSIADPARALVREAVQNVLDARRGDGPLRVRLEVGEIPAGRAEPYLAGLRPHVEAVVPGSSDAFEQGSCRFLVIEDFGTTGLTGDIDVVTPEPGERNNYHSFVWAEGSSSKAQGDRGRWGLGKYVFPKNSRVFSFFALTVQHPSDGAPILRGGEGRLLIGISVLKNHRAGGVDHVPDGYWARQPEERPSPFFDTATIEEFCSTWSVQRSSSDGGLSLILPHLDPQVDRSALLHAVVAEYFIAIHRGQITFVIADEDEEILIDAGNLRATLAAVSERLRDHVERSLDLLTWWARASEDRTIRLPQRSGEVDELLDDTVRSTAAALLSEEHGRLAVEVPVSIRRDQPGARAEWSSFTVLFESDPGAASIQTFSRGGLIIPDVRGAAHHGVRSILIAEEPGVTQFLGDAEDPGHTQWKESGEHFKGRYEKGPKRLRFIRHFPGNFIRAVRRDDDDVVEDFLDHWLSVEIERGPRPGAQRGDGPGKRVVRPDPPEPPAPRTWRMERHPDGSIRLTVVDSVGSPIDSHITFAYDVAQGDAFGRYEPFDFVVAGHPDATMGPEIQWESSDGVIEVASPNRLIARGVGPGATIVLRGFDVHRDVKIDASPMRGIT
jgi:hypothetical protein